MKTLTKDIIKKLIGLLAHIKTLPVIIVFTFLFFCAFQNIYAQSYTVRQTGAWDDPDTWNPNGVPQSGNTVTLSSAHTVTFSGNLNWTSGSIQGSGGNLIISGDFNVTGGGFNFWGPLNLDVGGDFNYSNNDLQLGHSGAINIGGNFNLTNNLTLSAYGGNFSVTVNGILSANNLNVAKNSILRVRNNVVITNSISIIENGIIDVDGKLMAASVYQTNTGLLVVEGDFVVSGNYKSDSNATIVVAGDYIVSGTTEISNTTANVYVFNDINASCTGSGCPVDNFTQWNVVMPGQQYLSSATVIFSQSGSFTVPDGVTEITVQAWGGGAGGGGGSSNRRGGGGGGAYTYGTISVIEGNTYNFIIGAGGNQNQNGGNTTFNVTSIVAAGGLSNGGEGGAGGQANDCIPNTNARSGGNGGDPSDGNPDRNPAGGGGGGSAYTNSNGVNGANGSGTTGGEGGAGTGNGGTGGGSLGSDGQDGSSPGGGGGGRATDGTSGSGAPGQIIITWTTGGCTPPATPTAGSNSPICAGSTLTLTASTISDATYSWTGPNGFTSSEQNPNITNASAAATGSYSVTATVDGCTSSAGTTLVTVDDPVATVSRFSLNNECPELFNNQGFNANSGNYDAGSTKIVFTVTLNSDPSSGWNFDYELTGANIRTGLSGAGIDPYYELSTGNIPVPAGDSYINLTFYVDNDPPVIVEPLLTIRNVSDGNCTNPSSTSESVTIKAMPDVGDYE